MAELILWSYRLSESDCFTKFKLSSSIAPAIMYNLLMTNTASGNDGKGKFNLPASKLPQTEDVPQDDFRASLHWRVFRILSE